MFSFPYFCYYCIVSVLSRIVWVIRKCQNFFQWFIDLAVETHMYPTYILVCLFGNLSNSRGTNHLLYFCGIIPDRKKKSFFLLQCHYYYLIFIIFYSAELSLSDWRKCSFCCCFWAAIEEIHPSAILVSFLPSVSFKVWPLDLSN